MKDWDINIYRGVLTGCNEAFIISGEKREEILQNCATEDEKKRTAELIRPILRGRDIKRYGYEWAKLYLIATFPARKYNIEQYPSVKHYLLSFAYDYLIENNNELVAKNHLEEYCMKKLSQSGEYIIINGKHVLDRNGNKEKGRKKTTNKWFETQDSISYWDDFFKPKLFYADITQELNFALCNDVMFCNNTTYFLTADNPSILPRLQHYLNSKLMDWYYRTLSVQLGEKAVRMFSIYVLNIPIPKSLQEEIYKTYCLTNDEINYIERR